MRDAMTDDDLLRYSRHILLDAIGIEGQERLLDARALLIGAGGLGSPVALYLATAGVGQLTIVDHDNVDLTNLQRQVAHNMQRIGQSKAMSAALTAAEINPTIGISAVNERVDASNIDALVVGADVVIDCSDNQATRQLVNAACVAHAKPLVSGSAIGFDGQVSVYDTRAPEHPCYACVFPADAPNEDARCATMGVFAPLVGVIGSMQATESLKLLARVGVSLAGRLQMLDARSMEWTELRAPRDRACRVCAGRERSTLR